MDNPIRHSAMHRLTALPALSAMALLRRFPDRIAATLCDTLALIAYAVGIRRRIIRKNLQIAFPELPDAQRRKIEKEVFFTTARMLSTWMTALNGGPDLVKRWVNYPDSEELSDAIQSGRGVVMFTAHFCNWELLAAATALKVNGLTTIANTLRNPYLDERWTQMHDVFGIRTVFRKSSMREMLRTLKRGECLGLLVDQSGSSKDAFVPFFGRPTCFRRGAARIAVSRKAALFTVFLLPGASGGYDAELEALPYTISDDPDADTEHIMAVYAARLESVIRRHPGNYFWFHNRWKKSPPAAPERSGPEHTQAVP